MVVSPHGHKFRKSCGEIHANAGYVVVTNNHNESQRVTKSHQAPTPAYPGGHKRSQSRTTLQRQQFRAATKGHKVAPRPSASSSGQSQRVTKSHQTPTPVHPGGHKRSQSRITPQRQRVWAVTKGHKNAAGPSSRTLHQTWSNAHSFWQIH